MRNNDMPDNNDSLEAEKLFLAANVKIDQGQIGESTEILLDLISKYPAYGRAYNHLGWVYETKFKEYTKAEIYYKKALEYSPDYAPIYFNYSFLLANLEKYDELKELLDKGLKIPGANKPKLYNEYGLMLEIQKDYQGAKEYFKQAIASSLSIEDIEIYKKSIQRCDLKIETLK